jgi:hypothetical protein
MGADCCIVEFSVIVGTVELVIVCCDVLGCSWFEYWEVIVLLQLVVPGFGDRGEHLELICKFHRFAFKMKRKILNMYHQRFSCYYTSN